jgi:hypothetical protein
MDFTISYTLKENNMAKETKGKDKGKEKGKKLEDKLFFNLKNCWEDINSKTEKEVEDFASSYKQFLDRGKTERECVESGCE